MSKLAALGLTIPTDKVHSKAIPPVTLGFANHPGLFCVEISLLLKPYGVSICVYQLLFCLRLDLTGFHTLPLTIASMLI